MAHLTIHGAENDAKSGRVALSPHVRCSSSGLHAGLITEYWENLPLK